MQWQVFGDISKTTGGKISETFQPAVGLGKGNFKIMNIEDIPHEIIKKLCLSGFKMSFKQVICSHNIEIMWLV